MRSRTVSKWLYRLDIAYTVFQALMFFFILPAFALHVESVFAERNARIKFLEETIVQMEAELAYKEYK